MYQVLGLAFDGCQASGLTSPFDVFNVINTIWKQQRGEDTDLYQCRLVSDSGETVTCSNGMRLQVDAKLDNTIEADLIIVPGIHHLDSKSLLKNLHSLDKERIWLHQKNQQGTTISANCSGVFLLAEAGGLTGKNATTSWWLGGLFRKRYPEITLLSDMLLVKDTKADTDTYCTGSMTANLGVMLEIAEQQVGRQLAQSAARTMLLDASQNSASPYLFIQEQSDHQDSLVLAVEGQMQREISHKLNLATLAETNSVSVRTLSRRFKKANGVNLSDYHQRIRLEKTKLLLETTNLSIEKIVEQVGYSSPSSLRRLFNKELGLSPREYRAKHQQ